MVQEVLAVAHAVSGQESLSEVLLHAKLAAALAYGLQFLKRSKRVTFISHDTARTNRWVSGIAALGSTLGINATYDPQVGGTIALPALAVFAHGVLEWLGQWLLQQMIYDGVIDKASKVPLFANAPPVKGPDGV